MTEFGPAPINQPCPDCGVFPVDGYMSHLTTCPSRSMNGTISLGRNSMEDSIFPMPEMDYDLSKGIEVKGRPSLLHRLLAWLRWKWSGIYWPEVWLALAMVVIGLIFLWLILGGASEINDWLEGT